MKNCVFTICAKNYIGLAQVLEKSILKLNDVDFYIFVVDKFIGDEPMPELSVNVIFAEDELGIEAELWNQMAFKYTLTEFCTAIKPFSFQYLLGELKYDRIIYFDPDIFVFNSLNDIFAILDKNSVILTPHIVNFHIPFKGEDSEFELLAHGVFNLGFIALKNSETSNLMLRWWSDRLVNDCFIDDYLGLFTDQKWINFLPCLVDRNELFISRDIGLNVAPWNFFERELIVDNGNYYMNSRGTKIEEMDKLVFVHFSGYNYSDLEKNLINHNTRKLRFYEDLEPVFKVYSNSLLDSKLSKYLEFRYSYNYFENGIPIINIQRRFFRQLIENGYKFEKPFSFDKNSFFEKLKRNHLVIEEPSNIDKITHKNLPGYDTKMKIFNYFFKCVKFIFGFQRYILIARFFKKHFREENQIFLISKKNF